MKKTLLLAFFFLFLPHVSFAHQPNIVRGTQIEIKEPEISKAYYGELSNSSHSYYFSIDKEIELYVNLLVPEGAEIKQDFLVRIVKNGSEIYSLKGDNAEWKIFNEPYGNDSYIKGPEYDTRIAPGNYEVIVSNKENKGKYVLAVGKKERFTLSETISALKTIPVLKKDFFNTSPAAFIFSPLGIGYVLVMFILAFIFGFLYRSVAKRIPRKAIFGVSHNIGKFDRVLRFILFIALFVFSVFTNWSWLLLFFSGFCLFESLFSWCGFYAIIGKNTCPIDL